MQYTNEITSKRSSSENLGDQKDINYYAAGMKKHLHKKLEMFKFIPEDVNIFIDIGCATGDLLRTKYEIDQAYGIHMQDRIYIGVDISEDMLKKAEELSEHTNIIYTNSLQKALNLAVEKKAFGSKTVITLSSVLHEVIHYQPANTHQDFWFNIWHKAVDYVAIRDFSVNAGLNKKLTALASVNIVRERFKFVCFPVDHPLAGRNVLDTWENGYPAVSGATDPLLANDFKGWGSINNQDSFAHFLMTFEYLRLNDPQNYDRGIRELHENYMSLPFQSLCRAIPASFTPVYLERGITANRNRYLCDFFGGDILSAVTPAKGFMVFKQRINPNKILADSNLSLNIFDPVIRVLKERCINYLTQLIKNNNNDLSASLITANIENLDKSVKL